MYSNTKLLLLKFQEIKKKNVGNMITEIPLEGGGIDDR
jgi:hypothetical protein